MVRDLFMFAGFNENTQIVWFKIIYSKEPGSLSLITDFLEKENAFIMFGHLDNITQKTGEYSVFTELKENIDPDNLTRKIKNLEVVSEVEYGISKYGMVSSLDFPLNVIGVRGVGWGILEIECDPKTYERKIIVKDSFIADVYGASDQPVCAFMSGYFAGYLTEYFGKNIRVREVSCKVKGKKVCEHLISLAPPVQTRS